MAQQYKGGFVLPCARSRVIQKSKTSTVLNAAVILSLSSTCLKLNLKVFKQSHISHFTTIFPIQILKHPSKHLSDTSALSTLPSKYMDVNSSCASTSTTNVLLSCNTRDLQYPSEKWPKPLEVILYHFMLPMLHQFQV